MPRAWFKMAPGQTMSFWWKVGRMATRLGIRRDEAKMKVLVNDVIRRVKR